MYLEVFPFAHEVLHALNSRLEEKTINLVSTRDQTEGHAPKERTLEAYVR